MNRLLFIFLILIMTNIHAKDDLKDWKCQKEIILDGENKYKYFFLDEEIYEYSTANLRDIRIIGKQKKTVPYYINEGYSAVEREDLKYNTKLIKSLKEKNDDSIFEFQVLTKKEILSNRIIVTADKKTYSNQVEIYGRHEGSGWEFIKKDTIYKIDEFQKNEIYLGDYRDYNFIKIKVLKNINNIKIKYVDVLYNVSKSSFYQFKKNKIMVFDTKNQENFTIVKIRNSHRNKIINLNLQIEGNYKRRYELFEKDTDHYLFSGSIYSFKHNDINISNNFIDLYYTNYSNSEYMILKIFNMDDEPLIVKRIEAEYLVDKITFEDKKNGPYYIYFGNDTAKVPSYDIESFKKYIENQKMDMCSLGKIIFLKKGIKKDGEEKEGFNINWKILFNILIVLIALGLIVFIVFKIKKK